MELIADIFNDILDKVDEIIAEKQRAFDEEMRKFDEEVKKNNFAVVCTMNLKEKYDNLDDEVHVFLDTIDEIELTDTTVSIDSANEDLIQVINDSDEERTMDSDGLVNNSHLNNEMFSKELDDSYLSNDSKAVTNRRYFNTLCVFLINEVHSKIIFDSIKFSVNIN